MLAALAILRPILSLAGKYRLQLAAALALLSAILWFSAHERAVGREGEQKAEAVRLEAAKKAIAQREAQATKISADASDKLSAQRAQIQQLTQALSSKVHTYVPPAADRQCVVNLGFVRAYDAAALGSPTGLSSASGGHLEAPSGIPLSDVLAADIANLGIGYDYRAEVIAWREWYASQKVAWEAR